MATNQEARRVAFMRKRMAFEAVFDHTFASCQIGYKKPDTRFYQTISQKLAKSGIERIIFFDDKGSNVAAANTAGWTAFPYSSLTDYLNSLEDWKHYDEDRTLSRQ